MQTNRIVAGALLCALFPLTANAAKEQRGLQAEDHAAASSLPVHIVVMHPRLYPQFTFNYSPVDTTALAMNAAENLYNSGTGIGYGQAMGAGVVGGAIAGVLIAAAEQVEAKNAVRPPYALVKQASCDIGLADSHHAALAGALQRSGWSQSVAPSLHALDGESDLDDVLDEDIPRYVFTTNSSFSPDFSALITTVDAQAYAGNGGKAASKPTWQDSLIVVSDGLWLPPKTQADIDTMVAAEKARYASSGADALIKKVNAAGGSAARQDRLKAEKMSSLHRSNMKDALDDSWSPKSTAARRAALWSENNCQRINASLQANLEAAGMMLEGLLTQSLPPRLQADEAEAADPEPCIRTVKALPGGAYVSRLAGENISLGFRYSILSDE